MECAIRITALGFRGFWRNNWNKLDFIIVAFGIIDFVPGVESGFFVALRTVRVLRPLRVVNRFPSLRILVRLLLDTIPLLGSVMVLCLFLFATFGIMGVQLWKGVLTGGCYDASGTLFKPSPESFYVCSLPKAFGGMNSCPPQMGVDGKHVTMSNYTECRKGGPNYQDGATSFDNILMSFLAVFQVITLEDWSRLMYAVQNGYSFWVWPFFVVLIVLGSWFAINLALVVIATQFRVTKKRETLLMQNAPKRRGISWSNCALFLKSCLFCDTEKMKQLRKRENAADQLTDEERRDLQMIKEVFDLLDEDRDGTISVSELRQALQVLDSHLPKSDLKELAESIDKDGNGYIDFDEFKNMMGCDGNDSTASLSKPSGDSCDEDQSADAHGHNHLTKPTALQRARHRVQNLVNHKYFKVFVVLCIVLNTATMSAEHHGQPKMLTTVVETTNAVFAFVFLIEVLMRIFSSRVDKYFLNIFNLFDFIIVILGVVDVFTNDAGNWTVLRSFRLLRLFKLARYLPTMQRQFVVMLKTLDSVLTFLILLSLFIFIFAIMGMHLFGGRLGEGHTDALRQNFDSFGLSLLTVFQVLTIEEWNILMYHTMLSTSKWAAVYYIVLISLGTYILVNLFVAIMVEGFATDPEAIARFKAALGRARAVFQKISPPQTECSVIEMAPAMKRTLSVLSEASNGALSNSSDIVLDEAAQESNAGTSGATAGIICCFGQRHNRVGVQELSNTPSSEQLAPKKGSVEWVTTVVAAGAATVLKGYLDSCHYLYNLPIFHHVMAMVLLADTLVLCLERPDIAKDSNERRFIDAFDVLCEVMFTLEMIIKLTAQGVWKGPDGYFKQRWNTYDFTLILSSWLLFALRKTGSGGSVGWLCYVLIIYRTTRPFRIVQRSITLKQTVHMLCMSVRPIWNLLLLGSLFYLIFAIWGMQMFKGRMFYCDVSIVDTNDTMACYAANGTFSFDGCSTPPYPVMFAADCELAGGTWLRHRNNFDNIMEAMLTLFVISSRDGWAEVMRNGMDVTGVERQPGHNSNFWAVVYFVSFLLIVGYFVVSMFVGVIVENFQLSMPLLDGDSDELTHAMDVDMLQPPPQPGKIRVFCHWLMHHKYFDGVMTSLIVVNVAMMACNHEGQSEGFSDFLEKANYTFTLIYIFEVGIKILGVGFREFARSAWNRFDAFVAFSSVVGSIFDLAGTRAVINPSVLRVVRVLRVARVLKLLKLATGLASLLTTVWSSMPQVVSLGCLLLVLFITASVLGTELFGKVHCATNDCTGISKHANFENTGMSMLTLFRISTGDDWVGIMRDSIQAKQSFQRISATVYFVGFVVVAQFVLLNVVVAVLMKNLAAALHWVDEKAEQGHRGLDTADDGEGLGGDDADASARGASVLSKPKTHPLNCSITSLIRQSVASESMGASARQGQEQGHDQEGGHGTRKWSTPVEKCESNSTLSDMEGEGDQPEPYTPSTALSTSATTSATAAAPVASFLGDDGGDSCASLESDTSTADAEKLKYDTLLADLQQRTQRLSVICKSPPKDTATIEPTLVTNKKALKASLHLVMAMVRMMDNVDPRHSALAPSELQQCKNVRLSIRRPPPRSSVLASNRASIVTPGGGRRSFLKSRAGSVSNSGSGGSHHRGKRTSVALHHNHAAHSGQGTPQRQPFRLAEGQLH